MSERRCEVSTITKPETVKTVDEYDRMIEDGDIGEDEQVELWDGNVVPKMPKGPRHRVGTTKTAEALERVIPPVWHVARENGVVLNDWRKPEPDVAVIRAELKYDSSRDARAEDCCLVVEVAESSLTDDQGYKLEGYAGAGIPVYWIINLRAGRSRCIPIPTRRRVGTASTSITVPVKPSRSPSTVTMSARSTRWTCSRSTRATASAGR